MKKMKPFTELDIGFSNAENYRLRGNKDILQRYFVRDSFLEDILDHNKFFLVGEKGTGKTAYSTYLRNTKYKNINAFTYDIRQTDYQKFLDLKNSGALPLSRYVDVWQVILQILCATSILERSGTPAFLQGFTRLNAVKEALDLYQKEGFSPEVAHAINIVESEEFQASLAASDGIGKAALQGKAAKQKTDSKTGFQTNLHTIRRTFEAALSQLKLTEDYVIFLDGIDIRPPDVEYSDYFACVQGLINAVWSVNFDFLSNIKDSKGRIRVVLLVRPDILMASGLHNLNTKLRDNSVYLDWQTSYQDYKTSRLFAVADHLLAAQQDEVLQPGEAWNWYFPFSATSMEFMSGEQDSAGSSFLSFLRFSYYRPRDINSMMAAMKDILKARGEVARVSEDDFNDPKFRDAVAHYLMGEVRDQLLFYYGQNDYEAFINFFKFLRGSHKFSYDEYRAAFSEFLVEHDATGKPLPKFFHSEEAFLQFLYDQNVICYFEESEDDNRRFLRWCFRERSPVNPTPKVRLYTHYEIFYGLKKALNVGRKVKENRSPVSNNVGVIVRILEQKRYGFIRASDSKDDVFFHFNDVQKGFEIREKARVRFEVENVGGKARAKHVSGIP